MISEVIPPKPWVKGEDSTVQSVEYLNIDIDTLDYIGVYPRKDVKAATNRRQDEIRKNQDAVRPNKRIWYERREYNTPLCTRRNALQYNTNHTKEAQ